MHTIIRIISIIFLTLTINFAYAKNDKLTIGLDWFINPDHAPLIIAQKRGFFKEVGLEVEMIEPADPNDPPKLVAAGKLDLAISYQPQLHIQVDQGLPVVRVGTLVSVPLNSLVVLKDGPIKSIADLKGKKIGFSVGGFEEALLSGMLQKYNLKMSDVELININFSLSPSLIAKKVDAVIGAFRNFELNQMDIVNHPGLAFYPEEHGVPSYEELIYISNTKNRNNPIFNKFFKAIQKATLTIINDPQSTWEDFSSFRKGLDDELNKRAYRDTLSRFALRPQAHDLNTYKEFGVFLKEKGIIKKTIQVEKFAKP
ncbi:ABC transporter substrate-binding protein [Alphaproteobacteria bacterium]|jgi:putative hydroxymethylpyrimidine transport system substrate-binding protein|nr:ABC transporter substrate-binding protein [Alphaproteobacteria bacterium]